MVIYVLVGQSEMETFFEVLSVSGSKKVTLESVLSNRVRIGFFWLSLRSIDCL